MKMSGIRVTSTPSGRMHFGNLRTAWIASSWADLLKEPLTVRMQDLDPARVLAGAEDFQIKDLERLTDKKITGLERQSANADRYLVLLKKAIAEGKVYVCICSHSSVTQALAVLTHSPKFTTEYAGRCRDAPCTERILKSESLPRSVGSNGVIANEELVSWRWKSASDDSGLNDTIVAKSQYFPSNSDKVDNCFSKFTVGHHWACAVDDAHGQYRFLINGWDRAGSFAIQTELRNWVETTLFGQKNGTQVFHTTVILQNDERPLDKKTKVANWVGLAQKGLNPKTLIAESFGLVPYVHQFKARLGNPDSIHEVWGETPKYLMLKEISKMLAGLA